MRRGGFGMVMAAHGRWVPLAELRVACGVSREGSSAGNIVRAARTYGMDAKGGRYDVARLKTMPMPMIAFVNMNHFVVLEGFARGAVLLNDPAFGRRRLTEEEFSRQYSGIVLTFAPTAPSSPGAHRRPHCAGCSPACAVGAMRRSMSSLPALLWCCGGRRHPELHPGVHRPLPDRWPGLGEMAAGYHGGHGPHAGRPQLPERHHPPAPQDPHRGSGGGQFVWRLLRLPLAFYGQRYPGSIGNRVQLAQETLRHCCGPACGAGGCKAGRWCSSSP